MDPLNKVGWPFKTENFGQDRKIKDCFMEGAGIGDDIIFLSLVPEAFKIARTLSVYIDPRLISLCKRSMPDIKFCLMRMR